MDADLNNLSWQQVLRGFVPLKPAPFKNPLPTDEFLMNNPASDFFFSLTRRKFDRKAQIKMNADERSAIVNANQPFIVWFYFISRDIRDRKKLYIYSLFSVIYRRLFYSHRIEHFIIKKKEFRRFHGWFSSRLERICHEIFRENNRNNEILETLSTLFNKQICKINKTLIIRFFAKFVDEETTMVLRIETKSSSRCIILLRNIRIFWSIVVTVYKFYKCVEMNDELAIRSNTR